MDILVGVSESLPRHLFDALACYRHRVFVERLGWQLQTEHGLEFDQFDRPDTVYVVACADNQRVIGCARLLPTLHRYLLADVFPELLQGRAAPCSADVWELSRFAAVDFDYETASAASDFCQFSSPTAVGLLRACLASAAERGARELITVSPLGVERLLRQAGFEAQRFASPRVVDGRALFACRITVPAIAQGLQ